MKTALYTALNFGFYSIQKELERVCAPSLLFTFILQSHWEWFFILNVRPPRSSRQLFCFSHRIIYNSIFVIQCLTFLFRWIYNWMYANDEWYIRFTAYIWNFQFWFIFLIMGYIVHVCTITITTALSQIWVQKNLKPVQ